MLKYASCSIIAHMRFKELAISAAFIAFTATACKDNPFTPAPEPTVASSSSERVGVENKYSWQSPGGTIFNFDAIDFPGTFYPDAITQALGKYCNKPLVLPSVNVFIGPVEGFNPNTGQIDPNGTGRGITIMKSEKSTNKPIELKIGIAGGYFQKLKNNLKLRNQDKYYYTSPHIPGEKVITDPLYGLNGSIFEEVAYHACTQTTGVTPLDFETQQTESAKFHMNFLRNPTVMFKPKGW